MKNVILIRIQVNQDPPKPVYNSTFSLLFYGVVYKKWSVFSIDFTTNAAYWQLIQHTLFSDMMKYQMQYMCPLKKQIVFIYKTCSFLSLLQRKYSKMQNCIFIVWRYTYVNTKKHMDTQWNKAIMLNVSFSIETFIMIHFNLEMMLVYCLNTYHSYSKMNQKKVKIVIGYKLFVIFVHVDLWKTLNKKLVNSFKIAIYFGIQLEKST